MFEGHDLVTFGVGLLAWEHADISDVYEYQLADDGRLSATRRRDAQTTMQVAFNSQTNELTWDGRRFRLVSAGQALARVEPPFEWLMQPGNKNGELEIDLNSANPSRGRLGFGLGSLTVQTYGIAGGFQVFDMLDEVEGGYTITRDRIPAAEGKATVQLGAEGLVTTSFPAAESKVVRGGNFLLEHPAVHFWRQKAIEVDDEWLAVHFCDLREGGGAPVEAGQHVVIRCFFYTDQSFEDYLPVRGKERH